MQQLKWVRLGHLAQLGIATVRCTAGVEVWTYCRAISISPESIGIRETGEYEIVDLFLLHIVVMHQRNLKHCADL